MCGVLNTKEFVFKIRFKIKNPTDYNHRYEISIQTYIKSTFIVIVIIKFMYDRKILLILIYLISKT